MVTFARTLRAASADAKLRIWHQLKNRNLGGFKFRRQHSIPPYTVDFICIEQKLVVELDGGQHLEQRAYDAARTACLESKGFRVIRFWDDEALKQADSVLEEILRQLTTPHPSPRPALRGEGVGLWCVHSFSLSPQLGRGLG